MSQSFLSIAEIADTVAVKNRMLDAFVIIEHDREELKWNPQEVKQLARTYAHWFINRSTIKRDLRGKAKVQRLVILGGGKDESPLQAKDFAGPQQLVDKPWFAPDGTPLKEIYVDVHSTGVEEVANKIETREAAQHDAKSAEVKEAVAEKTAARVAEAMGEDADEPAEPEASAN